MSDDQSPVPERLPAGESDWLRPAQAAELLGVAQSTVRTLTKQGRLPPFYTEGGHRRYRRRDLVRVKLELEVEGAGARVTESPE